jgi:hypothetical protein
MAFDDSTRNRLQRFVSDARALLSEEFTRQMQHEYGMDPTSGEVADLDKLSQMDDTRRETARLLRDTLAHYLATTPSGGKQEALQRILREQAFTVLNRLAALRMMEARGFLIESIARGYQSKGFQLYQRLVGSALGETGDAYRCYLFSLFDEFALNLAVLFDRFSPQGRLFPRESALLGLLNLINDPEIEAFWAEDETIGWIYQYFNSQEERRQMRADSPAPRNSRELAVRNQFFTPRYVVEFLTDNTLGRIWYEMTEGRTALKDQLRYLVRRPNETFLGLGEQVPEQAEPQEELSQEELLQEQVYIPFRAMKDPRDITLLDPACGSMHFGLYAFDLYERIYEEAWELESQDGTVSLTRSPELHPLHDTYTTKEEFLRDMPRLIIEGNIHGIDIDPRAVQIAGLSLWLRAQRSWQLQGVKPQHRPQIQRSNIVCAEPMPGEQGLLQEFTAGLQPHVLGQLVELIFEKMHLAGEAGSLLKVEEEIRGSVEQAREEFNRELLRRKETEGYLIPEVAPKRQPTLFDFADLPDRTRFWDRATQEILDALKTYVEQAEGAQATQKRLFAQDTGRGFAFVDLCHERFDVVLMNPPFGEFSKGYKPYAKASFPDTYNDIFATFVDRCLGMLRPQGMLGAITSRTGFFLTSFTRWRKNVLLERTTIQTLADLGSDVLDTAMVETAAYCLEHGQPKGSSPFIRVLVHQKEEKQIALQRSIESINEGHPKDTVFLASTALFAALPDSPFVYWVPRSIQQRFLAHPTFEPAAAEVRVGLQTGDDPRFVRALWEVRPADYAFCYYPSNGESFCRFGDPIVQAFMARRHAGRQRWAFHVKAGASQPWFSPITVVVDWENDGQTLRHFTDEQGKLRSRPQNMLYYFRPGFSWTRRAVRFIPYAIPTGCISTVSRYMAFPKRGEVFATLGVAASNCASAFLRFYGEKFEWPNFLVDNLKALPWPTIPDSLRGALETLADQEVSQRRHACQIHEPFQEFTEPFLILPGKVETQALAYDAGSLVGPELEREVVLAYGLETDELPALERDLQEALAVRRIEHDSEEHDDEDDEDRDFVLNTSPYATHEALVSYAVGCAFGRWDVRIGCDVSLAPALPGPFDPMPVCPPGMLVGPDGLPAVSGSIVSKEWLRKRPSAITLPPENSVKQPTVPDSVYPLYIDWDGILVDDPDHPDDIVRQVREVLRLICHDRAEVVEQETCELLDVKELRAYFRKLGKGGFWDDHLKRYSKSRRQAPIYWPLQTASGSYTLWLYYHRLTDQTLYTCVNDFVECKLKVVAESVNTLRTKADRSRQEDKTLEQLLDFEQELKDFRNELLRVAGFWKPNLNDGVQITAAPLWKLFQHKPWQKTLKETWDKLEHGDYDWAHLAYSIWPDRVREKCRHDKSLAIAHGLEELHEEPSEQPKKRRRRTRG